MRLFDVRVFVMHLKKKTFQLNIEYHIYIFFMNNSFFLKSKMNKIFVLVSFFLVTYAYVNILNIAECVQLNLNQWI